MSDEWRQNKLHHPGKYCIQTKEHNILRLFLRPRSSSLLLDLHPIQIDVVQCAETAPKGYRPRMTTPIKGESASNCATNGCPKAPLSLLALRGEVARGSDRPIW